MKLESTAFQNRATIPEHYTCYGKNVSPPLQWSDIPPDAQELALICLDPDAPQERPFVHWVAYHIPTDVKALDEDAGHSAHRRFVQGENSAGETHYMGPKPPAHTGNHRYYFKLFALNAPVHVRGGATADELQVAMQGHVIAEAETMGRHAYH